MNIIRDGIEHSSSTHSFESGGRTPITSAQYAPSFSDDDEQLEQL